MQKMYALLVWCVFGLQNSLKFLYVVLCTILGLSLAVLSLAQEEKGGENSLPAPLIEVSPPQGWKRSYVQEASMFKGCYVYTAASEDKVNVSVLACMVKGWQDSCEEALKRGTGTVRRIGKAYYLTQSDTNILICMPARKGKEEAFFAVTAEDAFRKYEARDMLAAFKHFDVPEEERAPAPDLSSYLPQTLVGEEVKSEWGGIKRVYKNFGETGGTAIAIVLPYFPHWADVSQYLRTFRYYFGDMAPEAHAWKSIERSSHPFYMILSYDKKVVLLLRCSDEAVAHKFQAVFDRFNW